MKKDEKKRTLKRVNLKIANESQSPGIQTYFGGLTAQQRHARCVATFDELFCALFNV